MKYFTLIALTIIFFSCKNNIETEENTSQIEDTIKRESLFTNRKTKIKTIKNEPFSSYQTKAVLIGEKIELFDENNKVIKDISSLNETIVSVISISNKIYFHKNEGDCNEYKWVKIKIDNEVGFVDGTKLYEPIKHIQNQKTKIGTDEIEITLTKNMGQREFDETGDPLYCYSDKPIVLKDRKSNYEGLVETIKNKYSEYNNHYFALFDDDSASDELKNIEKIDNKYILSILRVNQEGGANMKVAIYKDSENKFVAEILDYINIDEEELQKQLKK